MNFATSKEAQAAMHSRSAVFNNRFVIVEPYYQPNDPSTYDTKESLAEAAMNKQATKEDHEEKMKLIEDRQSLQNQQINNLENTIQKRLNLLKTYANYALNVKEEEKVKMKMIVDKVLIPLYEEAEQLHELYMKAGKNLSKKEIKEKIQNYLSAVISTFENTYLYKTLNDDVQNQLVSIFNKPSPSEPSAIRKSSSHSQHKTKYYPKKAGSFANQSKMICISNLPEGCTEKDISLSLTHYFGVKSIEIDEGQCKAFVSFEEAWHTKKPVKTGLIIKNKVGFAVIVLINRFCILSIPINYVYMWFIPFLFF